MYQDEIDAYLEDPIFRTCPVHPDRLEVFELTLKGQQAKIKTQAIKNYEWFCKKEKAREALKYERATEKASPKKLGKKRLQRIEEEKQRKRVFSASPARASNVDRIRLAQERMLLKQQGVRPEAYKQKLHAPGSKIEMEFDENYLPDQFSSHNKIYMAPRELQYNPDQYYNAVTKLLEKRSQEIYKTNKPNPRIKKLAPRDGKAIVNAELQKSTFSYDKKFIPNFFDKKKTFREV